MPPTTIRCSDRRTTHVPARTQHRTALHRGRRLPRPRARGCGSRLQRRRDVGTDRRRRALDAQGPARAQSGAGRDRHAADRPAVRAAHAVHDPAVGPLRVLPQARRGRRDRALPRHAAHGRRQRHGIRRLEAPGAARQAHRDLSEGHRSDRRLGHHPRPRAGERARRSPRLAAGSHERGCLRRAGRRLAVLRRAVRHLPLGRRGRGYRAAELANAGSIIKYVQLADAPGRGEPGTGSLDWPATLAAAARHPATTGRSASSTTRRRSRPSR